MLHQMNCNSSIEIIEIIPTQITRFLEVVADYIFFNTNHELIMLYVIVTPLPTLISLRKCKDTTFRLIFLTTYISTIGLNQLLKTNSLVFTALIGLILLIPVQFCYSRRKTRINGEIALCNLIFFHTKFSVICSAIIFLSRFNEIYSSSIGVIVNSLTR